MKCYHSLITLGYKENLKKHYITEYWVIKTIY